MTRLMGRFIPILSVLILAGPVVADSWVERRPMLTPRAYPASSTLYGKVYVIGGYTSAPSDVVEEYDPTSDTWIAKTPLLTPRYYFPSSASYGKIYVFGGTGSGVMLDSVEEYDPIADSDGDPNTDPWTPKARMSTVRDGSTANTVVVDGKEKIFVIGGNNATTPTNVVEEYDPSIDAWTNCGPPPYLVNECEPMPVPIGYLGLNAHSSCVIDNKIYAAGGSYGATNTTKTLQMYDPEANTWQARKSMPLGRRNAMTGSSLNGECFILGGSDVSAGPYMDRVEAYDPNSDQWTTRSPLLTGRAMPASSVASGKLYVFGGYDFEILGSVEEYVPDPSDSDGDGIPDDVDACPFEDSRGFDADLDGCIDTLTGLTDVISLLVDESIISPELANPLISKVENAAKSSTKENICAAVNQLDAFKNQIEAQRGKKLSDEAADLLIDYADNIIFQLLDQLPVGELCGT